MMKNKIFISKNLKILKNFYTTKTLVLVEHNNKILSQSTFHTFTAAKKLGGKISALVVGQNINYVSERTSKIDMVEDVFEHEINTPYFIPEVIEEILFNLQKKEKFTHIITNHSTFGKQILPKLGAKLDVQPITYILLLKEVI
jgi:electron transfer flavoprotein alpha subunit